LHQQLLVALGRVVLLAVQVVAGAAVPAQRR
jgi:hypothetical protein